MPQAAARPCSTPRCPHVQPCPDHRWSHDHQRGSACKRGYDAVWDKARRLYLSEHPFCEIGQKCSELPLHRRIATTVDHIVPLSRGGARLDPANFESACKSCHDWKTATQDGGGFRMR